MSLSYQILGITTWLSNKDKKRYLLFKPLYIVVGSVLLFIYLYVMSFKYLLLQFQSNLRHSRHLRIVKTWIVVYVFTTQILGTLKCGSPLKNCERKYIILLHFASYVTSELEEVWFKHKVSIYRTKLKITEQIQRAQEFASFV